MPVRDEPAPVGIHPFKKSGLPCMLIFGLFQFVEDLHEPHALFAPDFGHIEFRTGQTICLGVEIIVSDGEPGKACKVRSLPEFLHRIGMIARYTLEIGPDFLYAPGTECIAQPMLVAELLVDIPMGVIVETLDDGFLLKVLVRDDQEIARSVNISSVPPYGTRILGTEYVIGSDHRAVRQLYEIQIRC